MLRTHTGGTEELIEQHVTGVYTPIDRDTFISAAIAFLSDVPKMREMGRKGAAVIRQSFTFDQQLDKTMRMYQELLANRSVELPLSLGADGTALLYRWYQAGYLV